MCAVPNGVGSLPSRYRPQILSRREDKSTPTSSLPSPSLAASPTDLISARLLTNQLHSVVPHKVDNDYDNASGRDQQTPHYTKLISPIAFHFNARSQDSRECPNSALLNFHRRMCRRLAKLPMVSAKARSSSSSRETWRIPCRYLSVAPSSECVLSKYCSNLGRSGNELLFHFTIYP
jgi:hypothetical protein